MPAGQIQGGVAGGIIGSLGRRQAAKSFSGRSLQGGSHSIPYGSRGRGGRQNNAQQRFPVPVQGLGPDGRIHTYYKYMTRTQFANQQASQAKSAMDKDIKQGMNEINAGIKGEAKQRAAQGKLDQKNDINDPTNPFGSAAGNFSQYRKQQSDIQRNFEEGQKRLGREEQKEVESGAKSEGTEKLSPSDRRKMQQIDNMHKAIEAEKARRAPKNNTDEQEPQAAAASPFGGSGGAGGGQPMGPPPLPMPQGDGGPQAAEVGMGGGATAPELPMPQEPATAGSPPVAPALPMPPGEQQANEFPQVSPPWAQIPDEGGQVAPPIPQMPPKQTGQINNPSGGIPQGNTTEEEQFQATGKFGRVGNYNPGNPNIYDTGGMDQPWDYRGKTGDFQPTVPLPVGGGAGYIPKPPPGYRNAAGYGYERIPQPEEEE